MPKTRRLRAANDGQRAKARRAAPQIRARTPLCEPLRAGHERPEKRRRKRRTPDQTNQPVRTILVPVKKVQRGELDPNTREQKGETEEHRFPAVDCREALCWVVRQDERHPPPATGALLDEAPSRCESRGYRRFHRICPPAKRAAMGLARISKGPVLAWDSGWSGVF